MIVSKYFVFIHYPRTGGSFLRRVLADTAPDEWGILDIGGHVPLTTMPEEYRGLPVFGFVRNPFDWYVSWYVYLKSRGDNDFFNRVSENGARSFKDTIEATMNWHAREARRPYSMFRESLFGSHLMRYFGHDLTRIRIGKLECLRSDLLSILQGCVELPPAMEEAIRSHAKVNTIQHQHYREWYDDELRDRVLHVDRRVLDYFGYAF